MLSFDESQVREFTLRWRHNDHDSVSNHQPHGCLLNRLFRRRSKKTSKLRVTGLCAGKSPETGEFPAQMASYAENGSIWWRHHVISHGHFSKRNKANLRDLIAATGLVISNWIQIVNFSARVTVKFDGWPCKTIGHLFYATSSFVHLFVPIGEFKLKLQSGNAQSGSNWMIFRAVRPWNLTDDLAKQ